MGTSAERLIAQGRRRSHAGRAGGSPIHIEIEGLEETLKKMKKMEDVVRRKVMREAGKKAAKPMIDAFKQNIDDLMEDEFVVYRDGAIYARIQPGQLRKSIDVMFSFGQELETCGSRTLAQRSREDSPTQTRADGTLTSSTTAT
jgi:(2Fe-2S) ferredoxin